MKHKDSEILGQLIAMAFAFETEDVTVTLSDCMGLYKRLVLAEAGGAELAGAVEGDPSSAGPGDHHLPPGEGFDGEAPAPRHITGRGSQEKKEIHRRLTAYREARGMGCYGPLAAAAKGKLSEDEIRMMALGEGVFPIESWRRLRAALEEVET